MNYLGTSEHVISLVEEALGLHGLQHMIIMMGRSGAG
jgi:hypothetical protein